MSGTFEQQYPRLTKLAERRGLKIYAYFGAFVILGVIAFGAPDDVLSGFGWLYRVTQFFARHIPAIDIYAVYGSSPDVFKLGMAATWVLALPTVFLISFMRPRGPNELLARPSIWGPTKVMFFVAAIFFFLGVLILSYLGWGTTTSLIGGARYGRFSMWFAMCWNYLFIAGGVGVPIRVICYTKFLLSIPTEYR